MKQMGDKSCDIFTDPPYNVGKDYGNYKDNIPENEYLSWIETLLSECIRASNVLTVYVPKKWNIEYWSILGKEFQEIILPFRPAGALRYGFSNQYNKLLTNAKPKGKPILNVWENMQQPGLGFFFRENTYGHPGYTSEAITKRVIHELCINKTICDPFGGTGTTAVACKELGRDYILFETNKEYCDIAESRLRQEVLNL